MRRRTKGNTL